MLWTKKIALLAIVIALAAVPTAALALNPGPVSIVTNCGNTGENIIVLGQTQTFELTDITISNPSASGATVLITNTFSSGVQYTTFPNTSSNNVTQKFETPIQFKGPINSPFLSCS